jgi:hypothetical protein
MASRSSTRRSTRNTTQTARFSPESAPKPKRARRGSALSVQEENQMDLEPSSSSFVDSNRIATGTLTQIHSDSLQPGKLYSIWHKAEKTDDITDPVVGAEAGRFDSKDKYYVRFKGKFVGYDRGYHDTIYPNGISGIPQLTELAVFEEVRIISKNKTFFTRDIYLVGKRANNPNIKFGVDVTTYQQALNPTLVAPPPVNHPVFKIMFDRHITNGNGKGRVAFDMDYWSFANDFATLSKNLDSERQNEYNKFALNSFINPANPNLKATSLAMGRLGPNTIVAEYLGLKPSDIPKDIPEEQLSTLGSHFDAYVDLGKKYPRKGSQNDVDLNKEWNGTPYKDSQDEDDGPRSFDVDGGARRKTRRRKIRRNKTRSKRRRSTRSRK